MKKLITVSILIAAFRYSTATTIEPDLMAFYAWKYGLSAKHFNALAQIESENSHRCLNGSDRCIAGVRVSSTGAIGRMQVMPVVVNDRKCGDVYDEEKNIECGARQLKWLKDTYCGDKWTCLIGSYHDGGAGWRYHPSKKGKWHVIKFWRVMK